MAKSKRGKVRVVKPDSPLSSGQQRGTYNIAPAGQQSVRDQADAAMKHIDDLTQRAMADNPQFYNDMQAFNQESREAVQKLRQRVVEPLLAQGGNLDDWDITEMDFRGSPVLRVGRKDTKIGHEKDVLNPVYLQVDRSNRQTGKDYNDPDNDELGLIVASLKPGGGYGRALIPQLNVNTMAQNKPSPTSVRTQTELLGGLLSAPDMTKHLYGDQDDPDQEYEQGIMPNMASIFFRDPRTRRAWKNAYSTRGIHLMDDTGSDMPIALRRDLAKAGRYPNEYLTNLALQVPEDETQYAVTWKQLFENNVIKKLGGSGGHVFNAEVAFPGIAPDTDPNKAVKRLNNEIQLNTQAYGTLEQAIAGGVSTRWVRSPLITADGESPQGVLMNTFLGFSGLPVGAGEGWMRPSDESVYEQFRKAIPIPEGVDPQETVNTLKASAGRGLTGGDKTFDIFGKQTTFGESWDTLAIQDAEVRDGHLVVYGVGHGDPISIKQGLKTTPSMRENLPAGIDFVTNMSGNAPIAAEQIYAGLMATRNQKMLDIIDQRLASADNYGLKRDDLFEQVQLPNPAPVGFDVQGDSLVYTSGRHAGRVAGRNVKNQAVVDWYNQRDNPQYAYEPRAVVNENVSAFIEDTVNTFLKDTETEQTFTVPIHGSQLNAFTDDPNVASKMRIVNKDGKIRPDDVNYVEFTAKGSRVPILVQPGAEKMGGKARTTVEDKLWAAIANYNSDGGKRKLSSRTAAWAYSGFGAQEKRKYGQVAQAAFANAGRMAAPQNSVSLSGGLTQDQMRAYEGEIAGVNDQMAPYEVMDAQMRGLKAAFGYSMLSVKTSGGREVFLPSPETMSQFTVQDDERREVGAMQGYTRILSNFMADKSSNPNAAMSDENIAQLESYISSMMSNVGARKNVLGAGKSEASLSATQHLESALPVGTQVRTFNDIRKMVRGWHEEQSRSISDEDLNSYIREQMNSGEGIPISYMRPPNADPNRMSSFVGRVITPEVAQKKYRSRLRLRDGEVGLDQYVASLMRSDMDSDAGSTKVVGLFDAQTKKIIPLTATPADQIRKWAEDDRAGGEMKSWREDIADSDKRGKLTPAGRAMRKNTRIASAETADKMAQRARMMGQSYNVLRLAMSNASTFNFAPEQMAGISSSIGQGYQASLDFGKSISWGFKGMMNVQSANPVTGYYGKDKKIPNLVSARSKGPGHVPEGSGANYERLAKNIMANFIGMEESTPEDAARAILPREAWGTKIGGVNADEHFAKQIAQMRAEFKQYNFDEAEQKKNAGILGNLIYDEMKDTGIIGDSWWLNKQGDALTTAWGAMFGAPGALKGALNDDVFAGDNADTQNKIMRMLVEGGLREEYYSMLVSKDPNVTAEDMAVAMGFLGPNLMPDTPEWAGTNEAWQSATQIAGQRPDKVELEDAYKYWQNRQARLRGEAPNMTQDQVRQARQAAVYRDALEPSNETPQTYVSRGIKPSSIGDTLSQMFFRDIVERKTPENAAMKRGTEMHEAIQQGFDTLPFDGNQTLAQRFGDLVVKPKPGVTNPEFEKMQSSAVFGSQAGGTIRFNDIDWSLRPDLVTEKNGKAAVLDIKTTTGDPNSFDPHQMMQSAIYAVGIGSSTRRDVSEYGVLRYKQSDDGSVGQPISFVAPVVHNQADYDALAGQTLAPGISAQDWAIRAYEQGDARFPQAPEAQKMLQTAHHAQTLRDTVAVRGEVHRLAATSGGAREHLDTNIRAISEAYDAAPDDNAPIRQAVNELFSGFTGNIGDALRQGVANPEIETRLRNVLGYPQPPAVSQQQSAPITPPATAGGQPSAVAVPPGGAQARGAGGKGRSKTRAIRSATGFSGNANQPPAAPPGQPPAVPPPPPPPVPPGGSSGGGNLSDEVSALISHITNFTDLAARSQEAEAYARGMGPSVLNETSSAFSSLTSKETLAFMQRVMGDVQAGQNINPADAETFLKLRGELESFKHNVNKASSIQNDLVPVTKTKESAAINDAFSTWKQKSPELAALDQAYTANKDSIDHVLTQSVADEKIRKTFDKSQRTIQQQNSRALFQKYLGSSDAEKQAMLDQIDDGVLGKTTVDTAASWKELVAARNASVRDENKVSTAEAKLRYSQMTPEEQIAERNKVNQLMMPVAPSPIPGVTEARERIRRDDLKKEGITEDYGKFIQDKTIRAQEELAKHGTGDDQGIDISARIKALTKSLKDLGDVSEDTAKKSGKITGAHAKIVDDIMQRYDQLEKIRTENQRIASDADMTEEQRDRARMNVGLIEQQQQTLLDPIQNLMVKNNLAYKARSKLYETAEPEEKLDLQEKLAPFLMGGRAGRKLRKQYTEEGEYGEPGKMGLGWRIGGGVMGAANAALHSYWQFEQMNRMLVQPFSQGAEQYRRSQMSLIGNMAQTGTMYGSAVESDQFRRANEFNANEEAAGLRFGEMFSKTWSTTLGQVSDAKGGTLAQVGAVGAPAVAAGLVASRMLPFFNVNPLWGAAVGGAVALKGFSDLAAAQTDDVQSRAKLQKIGDAWGRINTDIAGTIGSTVQYHTNYDAWAKMEFDAAKLNAGAEDFLSGRPGRSTTSGIQVSDRLLNEPLTSDGRVPWNKAAASDIRYGIDQSVANAGTLKAFVKSTKRGIGTLSDDELNKLIGKSMSIQRPTSTSEDRLEWMTKVQDKQMYGVDVEGLARMNLASSGYIGVAGTQAYENAVGRVLDDNDVYSQKALMPFADKISESVSSVVTAGVKTGIGGFNFFAGPDWMQKFLGKNGVRLLGQSFTRAGIAANLGSAYGSNFANAYTDQMTPFMGEDNADIFNALTQRAGAAGGYFQQLRSAGYLGAGAMAIRAFTTPGLQYSAEQIQGAAGYIGATGMTGMRDIGLQTTQVAGIQAAGIDIEQYVRGHVGMDGMNANDRTAMAERRGALVDMLESKVKAAKEKYGGDPWALTKAYNQIIKEGQETEWAGQVAEIAAGGGLSRFPYQDANVFKDMRSQDVQRIAGAVQVQAQQNVTGLGYMQQATDAAIEEFRRGDAGVERGSRLLSQAQQAFGLYSSYSAFGTATEVNRKALDQMALNLDPSTFDFAMGALSGDPLAMSRFSMAQGLDRQNVMMYGVQEGTGGGTLGMQAGYDQNLRDPRLAPLRKRYTDTAQKLGGYVDIYSQRTGIDFTEMNQMDAQRMQSRIEFNQSERAIAQQQLGLRQQYAAQTGIGLNSLNQGIIDQTGKIGDLSKAAGLDKFFITLADGVKKSLADIKPRGAWDIEDDQVALQREQQKFSLEQDTKQLQMSQAKFDVAGQQWYEKFGMRERQTAQQQAWQERDLRRSQTQQQTQWGWQMEDLLFGRNRTELNFGWQMEDFDRNIRYARGRERRDLMRQQERAVISHSMDMTQSGREEDRLNKRKEWMQEEQQIEREKFEQNKKWTREEMEMDKRHFEQNRTFDRQQLEMQAEAHRRKLIWVQQENALEDQQRGQRRRQFLIEFEQQRAMQEILLKEQNTLRGIAAWMQSIETSNREAASQANAMARLGELLPVVTRNVTGLEWALRNLNLQLKTATTMGPSSGGGGSGSGGGSTSRITSPRTTAAPVAYAEGGYTGDGQKYEPAGEVHKGEWVVPQKGALVLRGDNPETVKLLQEIAKHMRRVAEKDPEIKVSISGEAGTATTEVPNRSKPNLLDRAYARH